MENEKIVNGVLCYSVGDKWVQYTPEAFTAALNVERRMREEYTERNKRLTAKLTNIDRVLWKGGINGNSKEP